VRYVTIGRTRWQTEIEALGNEDGSAFDLADRRVTGLVTLGTGRTPERLEPILYSDPPIRSLEDLARSQLDPRYRHASRFLVVDRVRHQNLDGGSRLFPAEEHDVSDGSVAEPYFLSGVRHLIGDVLRYAPIAQVGRTLPRHARSRPATSLPLLDDFHDPVLRSPMQLTIGRASVSAPVGEVCAPKPAPPQDQTRATARTAIFLARLRVGRPDDATILRECHRNRDVRARH